MNGQAQSKTKPRSIRDGYVKVLGPKEEGRGGVKAEAQETQAQQPFWRRFLFHFYQNKEG